MEIFILLHYQTQEYFLLGEEEEKTSTKDKQDMGLLMIYKHPNLLKYFKIFQYIHLIVEVITLLPLQVMEEYFHGEVEFMEN